MNKGFSRSLLSCGAIGLSFAAASGALAQVSATAPGQAGASEARAPANDDFDIVVTARQRSENLQNVPISIVAVSGEDLRKRGIATSSELQNHIPNLTINGAFGSSNPQIFIRGVGNNDYNDNAGAAVGVYLDGVFLNAPAGKLLQMFDVESVQVLRGPQGTLFGKNNTAGAILFNATKPGTSFEGYGTATIGNFGQRDFEAAVTVPLTDTLSARVSGNHRYSTGWGKTLNIRNEKVADIGGIDQWAGRVVLRWQPTDTDILLNLNKSRTDDSRLPGRNIGARPDGTDASGWINPISDPYINYSTYPEVDNVRTEGAFLNAVHHFSTVDITSITAIWNSSRFVTLDTDKNPNNELRLSRNPKAKQFSQELRLSSDRNDAFKWVIGATYLRENLRSANLWALGLPDPATANQPQDYTNLSKTKAAFAETDIELNPTFSLTVGARYSIDTRDFAMNFPVVGINNVVRDRTDKNFSGRVILNQKIADDISIYYSVSRGFQGGGFNGGAFSEAEIGDGYKPEELTAYEFGWKTLLADRRLRLNGAIFYYDYKDIQVFSLASGSSGGLLQQITNAKSGRLFGIEFDAEARVSSQLRLGAGLGLLDSKYQDPTLGLFGFAGAFFPADGRPFINAPKVDLHLSADYTVPLNQNAANFHVDYNYKSKRNFDITGRPEVSGESYNLLNGRIGFGPTSGRWNINVWGKNLLKETYKTFVSDLSGYGAWYETFFAPPRQYGVQVGVRF